MRFRGRLLEGLRVAVKGIGWSMWKGFLLEKEEEFTDKGNGFRFMVGKCRTDCELSKRECLWDGRIKI